MLGDSTGSRLYWELVETGIAEWATCGLECKAELGSIMSYVATEPDQVEKVSETVRRVLAQAGECTDEELARAKKKAISRVVMNGELSMGRMMSLGSDWLERAMVATLEDELARYRSISLGDISAALEKYPMRPIAEYRLMPKSD